MVGIVLWSSLILLGSMSLAQGLALVEISRRMRDLGGIRGELVRLRSRIDAMESRPVTRADHASPSFPNGPVRPNRRPEPVASPTLIAIPSLSRLPERSESNTEGLGRRYGELWARADAGESAMEIARDLGIPIGQVELILNLRKPADVRSSS